jgi:hypothetical protein
MAAARAATAGKIVTTAADESWDVALTAGQTVGM